jgi:hypothetical protein
VIIMARQKFFVVQYDDLSVGHKADSLGVTAGQLYEPASKPSAPVKVAVAHTGQDLEPVISDLNALRKELRAAGKI